MDLLLAQVDAFAERLFEGNPAAVVPLDAWLDDALLQSIALENNLSETAFTVVLGTDDDGAPRYRLRWFTPAVEVDLCGHATLATGAYLLDDVHPASSLVRFETRSGTLTVRRAGAGRLAMDFPAEALTPVATEPSVVAALRVDPGAVVAVLRGTDLVVVVDDPGVVEGLQPDLAAVATVPARGVVVTAPGRAGSGVDFVSRWFGPQSGVAEDPVTGSAHCALAPYWAGRLGRAELVARQVSARGGTVRCTLDGDRVVLEGSYRRYLTGTISL